MAWLYEGYPIDWLEISTRIKLRDEGTCQWCGYHPRDFKFLKAHHITPVRQGGCHDEHNLVTLCNSCYFWIHVNLKNIGEPLLFKDGELYRVEFWGNEVTATMLEAN